MMRLTARRLATAIPLALGVATLIFVLLESAPGNPVDRMAGDRPIPPEVRQRLEQVYGLDRSPVERYARWLEALVLHGDLGWSTSRGGPVSRVLAEALPPTLLLSGTALALHLLVAIALGLAAAWRRGRWFDRSTTIVGLALYAMPAFWLGLMAILALSYKVRLFPPSSMHSVSASGWPPLLRLADLLWHLALPAAVLGVASAAATARYVRAGVLRALAEGFVRAARARGATGYRVLVVHALRNAILPLINLVGLSLPVLVSGSLVIEVVFAWPGMGRLMYDAILAQDTPVVLAVTLAASVMVIVGNLAADLGLAWADPRIRLATRGGPP